MRLRRRSPFVDLVERQLRLFEEEHGALLAGVERALAAYDGADASEAEERYGDYVDLVDAAREELEGIRDAYASTLPGDAEAEYRDVFARLATRRLPEIALGLE
jgi:hypothetical protein